MFPATSALNRSRHAQDLLDSETRLCVLPEAACAATAPPRNARQRFLHNLGHEQPFPTSMRIAAWRTFSVAPRRHYCNPSWESMMLSAFNGKQMLIAHVARIAMNHVRILLYCLGSSLVVACGSGGGASRPLRWAKSRSLQRVTCRLGQPRAECGVCALLRPHIVPLQ